MTDETTGSADVDGSEMKLFETPVDLPEKVQVVDGKLGKEIGFVERDKVTELLRADSRYEGFEDPVTKAFMLSYNPDGARAKAILLETEDVVKFLATVEQHLDTAMGADDVMKLTVGVSYEQKGRAYVLSIHVRYFKMAARYLAADLAEVMAGLCSDRLIEALRRRHYP